MSSRKPSLENQPLDHRAGFREICDSEDFVEVSMVIVRNVRADLNAGKRYPEQIRKDLHKLRNAIRSLHAKSRERLLINLTAITGDDNEEAHRIMDTFIEALDHDMPSLIMDSRKALVGTVFGLFIDHHLPIDRSAGGLLTSYFERIQEATDCPWSIDGLTRDAFEMSRDGWRPVAESDSK